MDVSLVRAIDRADTPTVVYSRVGAILQQQTNNSIRSMLHLRCTKLCKITACLRGGLVVDRETDPVGSGHKLRPLRHLTTIMACKRDLGFQATEAALRVTKCKIRLPREAPRTFNDLKVSRLPRDATFSNRYGTSTSASPSPANGRSSRLAL